MKVTYGTPKPMVRVLTSLRDALMVELQETISRAERMVEQDRLVREFETQEEENVTGRQLANS